MPAVVVTKRAQSDLERLILTRELPDSTRARVRRSLRPLETYPLLGARVGLADAGYRFVLGPWPWMLLVYWFDTERDLVFVVSIEDARQADAATATE